MNWRALILAAVLFVHGCATVVLTRGGGQVPPGYEPPAGQCRIWYADRAPEQQPAPGECEALAKHVPAGARLVYGPGTRP